MSIGRIKEIQQKMRYYRFIFAPYGFILSGVIRIVSNVYDFVLMRFTELPIVSDRENVGPD